MSESRERPDPATHGRAAGSRIGVAGALIAVTALVWFGMRNALPSLPSSPAPTDRVVVVPFGDTSGDPAYDALGIVAADWITTELQRAGHAVVPVVDAIRARSHINAIAGTNGDLAYADALAGETGARIVVTGVMRRDGDSIRFTARVLDARGALKLDTPEAAAASVTDAISGIATLGANIIALLASLPDSAAPGGGRARISGDIAFPPDQTAYIEFANGLAHEADREWSAALEQYRASFATDSTFTRALVRASLCHLRLGALANADSVARIAEPNAARLPEWDRTWLRYVAATARGEQDDALRAIGQAWEMAPSSIAAWDLALTALKTNRPRIAWTTLLNTDPDRGAMRGWFPYWTVMTDALHRMGEHEQELVAARRAGELFPDSIATASLEAAALVALREPADLSRVMLDMERFHPWDVVTGTFSRMVADELRAHDQPGAADEALAHALEWVLKFPAPRRSSEPFARLHASLLERLGRPADAKAIVEAPATGLSEPERIAWTGRLDALLGDTAATLDAARALDAWNQTDEPGSRQVDQARILALIGRPDEALALLREARNRGWPLPRHPGLLFPGLAGTPAFEELIRPLN